LSAARQCSHFMAPLFQLLAVISQYGNTRTLFSTPTGYAITGSHSLLGQIKKPTPSHFPHARPSPLVYVLRAAMANWRPAAWFTPAPRQVTGLVRLVKFWISA
jgi:hypothetical protein